MSVKLIYRKGKRIPDVLVSLDELERHSVDPDQGLQGEQTPTVVGGGEPTTYQTRN